MRNYLLLLTLFIVVKSSGQKDTIFIERTVKDTPYAYYHAVFIDTASQWKNILTDFRFKQFDSSTYYDELKELKPIVKQKALRTLPFPKKWISLHRYKGKYYLYFPFDFDCHSRFEINDSTAINFTVEGPEPIKVTRLNTISSSHLIIEGENVYKQKKTEIKIIDPQKGIAVFYFGPPKYNQEGYHLLMVDASKTYLFPVIVNYCVTDRQSELEFDIIDFNELLNNNQKL
jgi:hypothetical protein